MNQLGGYAFDSRLRNYFIRTMSSLPCFELSTLRCASLDFLVPLSSPQHRRLALELACESAKHQLTSNQCTNIIFEGVSCHITRDIFERLCEDLFQDIILSIDQVLLDSFVSEVGNIILMGGSCHIPRLRDLLQVRFHGKSVCVSTDPQTVTVHGNAIQAAVLSGLDNCDDLTL